MINEIGINARVKDLTVAVTSMVAGSMKKFIESLPTVDDENALITFTDFRKGVRMSYDKDNCKVIVETFNALKDKSFKPFCTLALNTEVVDMPLLVIEFEQPEGMLVYNQNYMFEDYTGFFKVLNNSIGTTFISSGVVL